MASSKATLAQIFRQGAAAFMVRYAAKTHRGALQVLGKIVKCRSADMGARLYHCSMCETDHIVYNSCRNRHCPTCQGAAAHAWLDKQLDKLLPAPYFHTVFTLPSPIAQIAFSNRKVVLNILMKTAAQTLTTIAADPKRGGIRIGGTTVLHTWNSQLEFHPHVHAMVPNGGFDVNTGQWKCGSKKFFAPVKVLGAYFRNRFVEKLQTAYRNNELIFPAAIAHMENSEAFHSMLKQVRQTDWVVYAKAPFAGPRNLLKYLSRYTHRVAIGNSRILSFDGDTVCFRYRKPSEKNQRKPRYATMKLPVTEFIRRFLLHTLPSGFHRIRSFGILSNSNAKRTMAKIKEQTGWCPDQRLAPKAKSDDASNHPNCPKCKQAMHLLTPRLSPELLDQLYAARAPPVQLAA